MTAFNLMEKSDLFPEWGVSKLILLTDGQANGPMRSADIAKKFYNKLSVCIGIGSITDYDSPLLNALCKEHTYGGYSGETIRQNFIGAVFSMYTVVAKNIVVTLNTNISFTSASKVTAGDNSHQFISLEDFHPMRKIVLSFDVGSLDKKELAFPVKITYLDVHTEAKKIFAIKTVPTVDIKEFNTHIGEYCSLTTKFSKIASALNHDNKKAIEQQNEIDTLYTHMKNFKQCPLDNPIYDMWIALLFEMEQLNKLKGTGATLEEYSGSMTTSLKQQVSGRYTQIMKKSSDLMVNI